jgi:hypothetical protein|tara:strand:+ start:3982 stop:4185 length:204 start_codon:yes stop_codon:yes gene_type:complete
MDAKIMFHLAVAVTLLIFIVVLVAGLRSRNRHSQPDQDDTFESSPTSIYLDQSSIYWTNNNTSSWLS